VTLLEQEMTALNKSTLSFVTNHFKSAEIVDIDNELPAKVTELVDSLMNDLVTEIGACWRFYF
jgi:hypothetical protein